MDERGWDIEMWWASSSSTEPIDVGEPMGHRTPAIGENVLIDGREHKIARVVWDYANRVVRLHVQGGPLA